MHTDTEHELWGALRTVSASGKEVQCGQKNYHWECLYGTQTFAGHRRFCSLRSTSASLAEVGQVEWISPSRSQTLLFWKEKKKQLNIHPDSWVSNYPHLSFTLRICFLFVSLPDIYLSPSVCIYVSCDSKAEIRREKYLCILSLATSIFIHSCWNW